MQIGITATLPSRTGQVRARTLLRLLAVLLVAWAVIGTATATSAAKRDLIKVFVVADPSTPGGQLPTLQSIAASTLEDAGRAGEIFDLNRGLSQPDGGALTNPDDQLHPGWILRLPTDASGPDVKMATDTSAAAPQVHQPGTAVTLPLPEALAVVGTILLAFVTAAIVARRQVGRVLRSLGHGLVSLIDPIRKRRQTARRRLLGQRFAADVESVRRAYDTLGDVAASGGTSDKPVHALSIGEHDATAWLPASDTLTTPWQEIDSTRWRHPAAPVRASRPVGPEVSAACLVRAGTDAEERPVFIDLSRLDGVLSVTGDRAVARDVVQNLLSEITRFRPGLPVVVLPAADGLVSLVIPPGLTQIPQVPAPPAGNRPRGTVRGAAARLPLAGLVVIAGTPTQRSAEELLALCGTHGGGWTGLVCGPVGSGAHWRWHAGADGTVEIPILRTKLTVPA